MRHLALPIGGVALQSCNQTGVATDRLQRQDLAKLATAKLDLAQANNEARNGGASCLAAEAAIGWLGSIAASTNANAKPRATFRARRDNAQEAQEARTRGLA